MKDLSVGESTIPKLCNRQRIKPETNSFSMLLATARNSLSMSRRSWVFIFLFWLGSFSLVMSVQISSEMIEQHQDFDKQSESLYELIRQRLDQNEAVLGGLDALFKTFPDLEFDSIRGYSREMLQRYPHIYTIELQPRVDVADVDRFEASASKRIQHRFQIKDFDFGGERSWHPVPKRPFYFPITFMEPSIEAASPILGLDVYSEQKFRVALDSTILTGKPSISIPFDLLEGGRGYLIFKAIFNTKHPSNQTEERYRQVTQVVSMLIHTNKFLQRDELPSTYISMALHHKKFKSNDPDGIIDKVDAPIQNKQFASLFPLLKFSRQLSSESQPFVIETYRQLGLEIIHPIPTIFTAGATFAIALLLAIIYHQRRINLLAVKKSEDILFQEKEKALVTLHSINDAVITLDEDGRIRYMNLAAELATNTSLNVEQGRLIDQILTLRNELSQSLMLSPFAMCMDEKRVVDFPDNSVMVLANAQRILVEGNVSPLLGMHSELIGAVLIFRDMGPIRKKAWEAADASDKRLRQHQSDFAHVARLNTMGEMAAGIAHEINQPLAAILSYNQACIRLLQEEHLDTETIIHAMRSAAEQSKRAGEIIARLRAFVSKQAARSAAVDINQVVHNVLSLSEHTLKDSQTVVNVDLVNILPLVTADPIQIEQVVLNLIRNGIDAMKECDVSNRIIWIVTKPISGSVLISIKDNGHGIAADVMDHLFDPFFTTKKEGMGLGLTISYSIVETYGGTLTAKNHPDGGAEFSFSLAARDSDAIYLDLPERHECLNQLFS